MKRRDFLQIAGGMVVGAIIGGNAPNPVVLPARPLVQPKPPAMPTGWAYEAGRDAMYGYLEGLSCPPVELTLYFPTALDPEATAEYDQIWEEIYVETT